MTESLSLSLLRRARRPDDSRDPAEPLDLAAVPDTDPPPVRITEDEPVEFVLRCPEDVHPRLYIQDVELDRPFRQKTEGGGYEYWWEPHAGAPSWFLNHFGYCILTLEVLPVHDPLEAAAPSYVSAYAAVEVFAYAAVEVFARKPNAERAERILDYLESRMEDVSRSCFNAAHPGAEPANGEEHRTGDVPASVLLQAIAGHLETFAAQAPRFRYRKRCRLAPKPTRIKASRAANLTEHSVHWALTHLDTFMPVGAPTPGSIAVGGRFYELDEIETYALTEETNVYENQVIAGYLESIAARLSDVERFCLAQLQALESDGFVASVPAGYGSIFDIKRKVGRKRFGKLLAECTTLQREAADQSAFWRRHLPVARTVREMPTVTPGFLSSPHYHQAFRQVVAWHGLGRLNLASERFLYSLRTIDRLYEFYCLFRLVETLREAGWEPAGRQRRLPAPSARAGLDWEARPDNVYGFTNRAGERVTLFYEPEIERMAGGDLGLVRTMEGGAGFLPDFVLKFGPSGGGPPAFLILDAKYVSPSLALNFERSRSELTKITMKYLHGIGAPEGGRSPVQGIFVLHPQSFHSAAPGPPFRAYHARAFDLFSKTPAVPFLAAVELTPGDELPQADPDGDAPEAGDAALRRVLGRALELLGVKLLV